MVKIPKNRGDAEMMGGPAEEATFEHLSDGTAGRPAAKPAKKEAPPPAYAAFFTPEVQEDIGKALLTLKVNLYKQGVVDFKLKVACEADQVVVRAVPVTKPPQRPQRR